MFALVQGGLHQPRNMAQLDWISWLRGRASGNLAESEAGSRFIEMLLF
jgi:hypothetical protein